ncbi:MAG: hypothetical protein ABI643_01910 [Candidatus Doudnabacteria bacterium]
MKNLYRIILFFLGLLLPYAVSAHEAYVLPRAQFEAGLRQIGPNVFISLHDPGNLRVFFWLSLGILAVLTANFFFSRTKLALKLSRGLEHFSHFGPWLIRIAISAAFFFSAASNTFLGPEIQLDSLPSGPLLRILLFLISFLFLFGVLTELAAILALIIFIAAAASYHWYMLTYLNYLGKLILLILLGAREWWSVDNRFFGNAIRFPAIRKYEMDIVRIFYGIGLAYSAIDIKLLHSSLTIDVVNQYHLTRFYLLFPHDPIFVTLGAAFAEFVIGLFIALGFQLRLTVLVSLFYITLSLFFFRELVWPHFLLYGISLSLLITPQKLSLDNWLIKKFKL